MYVINLPYIFVQLSYNFDKYFKPSYIFEKKRLCIFYFWDNSVLFTCTINGIKLSGPKVRSMSVNSWI
jgi:hypothetical protein